MGKKIGLLLRSYAKDSKDVPGIVARAVKSINHATSLLREDGEPVFAAILVVVPGDYDCGITTRSILNALPTNHCSQHVYVIEVPGHHSCEALNEGIDIFESMNIDYAVILSNKAIKSCTVGIIDAMIDSFSRGAKVVGVAIDELKDFVFEGRVQNTFSGWSVTALRTVGGFSSQAGVEEVTPTVRLLWTYDKCIAVLVPTEVRTLDVRQTPDGRARHEEVMTTKLTRQQQEVQNMGVDFNFIKSGIMAGYPRVV